MHSSNFLLILSSPFTVVYDRMDISWAKLCQAKGHDRERGSSPKPGFPIWSHLPLPLTLLSEPRALQPGISPIQNR
jgi:hypothetical protein